jgi:hypothetical protein
MKILLLNQAFVSPDEPGHTRHFEMAQYLRAHGHELIIVASDLNYRRVNVPWNVAACSLSR